MVAHLIIPIATVFTDLSTVINLVWMKRINDAYI